MTINPGVRTSGPPGMTRGRASSPALAGDVLFPGKRGGSDYPDHLCSAQDMTVPPQGVIYCKIKLIRHGAAFPLSGAISIDKHF
jgi:hypothetical protein